MVRVIRRVMFRFRPSAPAVSKWTKLGPVCDFLIVGFALHNIFPRLFLMLSDPVRGRVAEGVNADLDYGLIQDLHFSSVLGKRYKASKQFLMNPDSHSTLLCLTVSLEALRFLSLWWMRVARDMDTSCGV